MIPTRDWPRQRAYPGLAHGWEGAAWIGAQTLALGGSPAPRSLEAVRRLIGEAPADASGASPLIGAGAAALLIARLSRDGAGLQRHYAAAERRWARALEGRAYDVMHGAAGALLGACEIEDVAPGLVASALVRRAHEVTTRTLERMLSALRTGGRVYLGLAHGVAGQVLALEMASAVFDLSFPARLRRAAEDVLGAERIDGARRARWSVWPVLSGETVPRMHGWCHGGPGVGLALLWASRVRPNANWTELADRALEGITALPVAMETFCCGTVGHAHILLDAYRCTGEERWLARARDVARSIADGTDGSRQLARGFHKGVLGRQYLDLRLADPRLPLFALGRGSVPITPASTRTAAAARGPGSSRPRP